MGRPVFALGVLAIVMAVTGGPAARASTDPSTLCLSAASAASRETGVPYDVLVAISLTETGRKQDGRMTPWPWTVNMEGKGDWFDDRDSALGHAFRHYRDGARSFDIGCFQINFKWHGQHFDSIDQMFEPLANARYAARFLAALHEEFGDWERAAGAFHSRTEHYAQKYRARFAAFRKNVDPSAPPVRLAEVAAPSPARAGSTYPLFTPGETGGMGSLMPIGSTALRPLWGARP